MQKKVIIISASPRQGGNSDLLCDGFARGVLYGTGTHEKGDVRALPVFGEA